MLNGASSPPDSTHPRGELRAWAGTHLALTRPEVSLVPRTDNRLKRRVRFCGDCGYALAPDNDGPCLMCQRFEQLRLDFVVPRPSALAEQRAAEGDTHASAAPDAWPPTVSEYRTILAGRQAGSTSTDAPQGRVVRTPGLTHRHVAPAPEVANAPDDGVAAPPVQHQRPVEGASSPPSKKAKRTPKAKGGRPRAPRTRQASRRAAEPDATPSSSAAPTSADRSATNSSEAALSPNEARRAEAAEVEPVPAPPDMALPLMQAVQVRRRELSSRARALLPSLVVVAMLAVSALVGAAVALLLSGL